MLWMAKFLQSLLKTQLCSFFTAAFFLRTCGLASGFCHGNTLLVCLVAFSYTLIIKTLRLYSRYTFQRRYGWGNDWQSYRHMSVSQAQEVYYQLAQRDFPFLYEFGWIIEIFKVRKGEFISSRVRGLSVISATDFLTPY